MEILIGLGVLTVLFGVLAVLYIRRYYIRIPPNKAGIVFGRRHIIIDPVTKEKRERGFRIIRGGSALMIPLLEQIEYLDLSNRKIELEVTDIRSLNGVKVDVQAVAIVRIGEDEPSLETAATQFGDMDKEDTNVRVQDILHKTLEGHFRTIISQMTPEGLDHNRAAFVTEVQKSAGNPLDAMGMRIVDFTIKRVSDKVEYLDSLGVPPAEAERAKAAMAKSEAEREVTEQQSRDKMAIREAQEKQIVQEEVSKGKEAVELIQVNERSSIAKIESELAKVKSEIEFMHKKIVLQEAEDELELIKVKFEQKKKVFEAAGDEQAARRKSREIENMAQAEAKAVLLRAEAEAEGKRMLAEAYKELDPTAKMLLIVERLPEILRALLGEEGLAKVFGEIAKPIGNVDSIKIYDFGGGGNGGGSPVDRFANTVPQMLMGMVSKLNDMGMGDLLQKMGLTSDALDTMSKAVVPVAVTPTATPAPEAPIVETKPVDAAENTAITPHEEIKVGDTIELEVKPKKKGKK
jgi:flotillin